MSACIKRKKLEEFLQAVDGFERPNILLEQYATPDHIASCMLYSIQSNFGDLEDKVVADLGSGCGMLSIGSFLLGAAYTLGFEIDKNAIDICLENIDEIPTIDCMQCDILTDLKNSRFEGFFDTVVMNPPFGTKHNAGIDMKFLQAGIFLTNNAVYSLHKTSTRDHIFKKAADWNVTAKVVAELKYNIPATYKFHKKTSVDIEVDFWRFVKQK